MPSSGSSAGEFEKLLLACREISGSYPDGVVFIGGIAVYLHSINQQETRNLAEFTHDADFYISLADMADLRDAEEVVANRRLSKHQLVKRGFEFDIYTERHSALLVPYDQVMARAVLFDTIRVASPEHLLVLKLEAYRARCSGSRGQKDAKDIIRLALVARAQGRSLDARQCIAYLSDEHLKLLDRIRRGPDFFSLAKGNAHQSRITRDRFSKAIERLKK